MTERAEIVFEAIKRHKKNYGDEPTKMDIHISTGLSRPTIDLAFEELVEKERIKKTLRRRGNYKVIPRYAK